MMRATWMVVASALAATGANAQTIEQRVDAVRNGTVQMTFTTRPGTCGDGRGSNRTQHGDRSFTSGDNGTSYVCVNGPVRVLVSRANGETVTIRKCVACRPLAMSSPDVDLGRVEPTDAAKYLLSAAVHTNARNADEAIAAAGFADAGDLTAEFSRIVRDESVILPTRRAALFWYGMSDGPTKELVGLDGVLKPYELREQFTFVLSQRADDLAIDKLIDLARHDASSQVRKQAMFWLGQTGDPKALKFFKDVLSP